MPTQPGLFHSFIHQIGSDTNLYFIDLSSLIDEEQRQVLESRSLPDSRTGSFNMAVYHDHDEVGSFMIWEKFLEKS